MAQSPTKNSSKSLFSWIIVIAVLCHVSSFAQSEKSTPVNPAIGLHYESRYSGPLVDISEDNNFMGMHMGGARSPFIKPRVPSLKREVAIDSTGKNITFTEKVGDIDFRIPRMMPLFNYVSMRRRNYMRDKFVQTSVSRLDETFGRNSGGGAIRIDIPVEIKSKAFQKIFGGGTVGTCGGEDSSDAPAELIFYERPDTEGPVSSTYSLVPVPDPAALKAALAAALGIRGVVKKRRSLYLAGETRIHIDEVEGLGTFLELEVVLETGDGASSREEGVARCRELMNALGVTESDLIDRAYIDLLEEAPE